MQIVDHTVLIQVFESKLSREQAWSYIQKMYRHAYPGDKPKALPQDEGWLTPNELRLLELLVTRCGLFGIHDPIIVYCGSSTYVFGSHDEYSGCVVFTESIFE